MARPEAPESIVLPYVINTEGGELKKNGEVREGGGFQGGRGRTNTLHTDHIPKTAGERWVMTNKNSKVLVEDSRQVLGRRRVVFGGGGDGFTRGGSYQVLHMPPNTREI